MARLALADTPPMCRQACFHSQQAAEKMLKALMELHQQPIPRSHDLLALLDSLTPHCPQLAGCAEDAAVLGDYGVGPRYPGVAFEATVTQAREALVCAERVVAAVATVLRDVEDGRGRG
jgi:HEPN domain-containing protein